MNERDIGDSLREGGDPRKHIYTHHILDHYFSYWHYLWMNSSCQFPQSVAGLSYNSRPLLIPVHQDPDQVLVLLFPVRPPVRLPNYLVYAIGTSPAIVIVHPDPPHRAICQMVRRAIIY